MSNKTKRVAKLKIPTFMFICIDGPETGPLRSKHLLGHLNHIEANNDRYRIAGPMHKAPGDPIYGSFFLVEAETEAGAWDIMRGDPYVSNEMYESITVNHFIPACGSLIGGIIWDQDEIRADMNKYT